MAINILYNGYSTISNLASGVKYLLHTGGIKKHSHASYLHCFCGVVFCSEKYCLQFEEHGLQR